MRKKAWDGKWQSCHFAIFDFSPLGRFLEFGYVSSKPVWNILKKIQSDKTFSSCIVPMFTFGQQRFDLKCWWRNLKIPKHEGAFSYRDTISRLFWQLVFFNTSPSLLFEPLFKPPVQAAPSAQASRSSPPPCTTPPPPCSTPPPPPPTVQTP